MPLAPYILSLCLHIVGVLLLWLWPVGEPLIKLEQPVQISLVEGETGGSKTPSPILGHMGEPGEGELAPSAPAERADVAAHAREETQVASPPPVEAQTEPVEEVKKPDVKPVPKPEPKPEPKENAVPKKKAPEPKKEPKKEQPKKEQPKKEQPQKAEKSQAKPQKASKDNKKDKSNKDAISDALAQAKRKATSRADSGDRGTSVEQALAEAKKNASGNKGGGGGEGKGPGGGGLHDVYLGLVMQAVRPNWGFANAQRKNMQCTLFLKVSKTGEVQECKVVASSGNAQYDASCVNAVMRTSRAGDFPPPPKPEYEELECVFTLNELMGR